MYHLAQVNIARARFALDDARMQGFVSRLAEINGLAESSPGFVWRHKDDVDGTAYIQVFEDDQMLFNMSVWESVEALKDFSYQSDHKDLLRLRHQWFEKLTGALLAMWWIPSGTLPTVEEAKRRLDHLGEFGETPFAFTFRTVFFANKFVEVQA
jgi:hypothetical protein